MEDFPQLKKLLFIHLVQHFQSQCNIQVMQRLNIICHCQPNYKSWNISSSISTLYVPGRFDEDGSWIGQYGTLRRKQQQRISTESGLPPGATYVWWSSWSSWWWWSWGLHGLQRLQQEIISVGSNLCPTKRHLRLNLDTKWKQKSQNSRKVKKSRTQKQEISSTKQSRELFWDI